MAAFPGTKTNCTVDGSNDLQFDAGSGWGEYIDSSRDAGTLDWRILEARFAWTQGGGPDGITNVEVHVSLSEDGAAWDDYIPWQPLTDYFRYYKFKITAQWDPSSDYPPKVTAFQAVSTKATSAPSQQPVIDSATLTPPAAPALRARYLIDGTGAGGWAGKDGLIAECIDADGPTWAYTTPDDGMTVYDQTADLIVMRENGSLGRPYCLQGRKPLGYAVEVACNGSITVIKEVTFAGGTYNTDKDEFFIKVHLWTGTPSVVNDQIDIDIDDGVGGGYVNVFTIVPGAGVNQDIFAKFHIVRGLANTACIVHHAIVSTAPTTATGVTNTTLGADWLTTAIKIRVRAMGDAGAKACAWLYVDRQK